MNDTDIPEDCLEKADALIDALGPTAILDVVARAIADERLRCVNLTKKHADSRIGGVTMDVTTFSRTPREIDAAKAANGIMRMVLTALADEMAGIPPDIVSTIKERSQ